MTTPVRLGVIGCGVIGQCHMRAAVGDDLIELAAVADLRPEPRQAAADEFGVPRTYADGLELLADPDIDAVALAMPAGARIALALAALKAGKHVLTEKPVARNEGEVRQMMAAAGERVVACCSSRYRFLPSADAATDFIASGALGALRLVQFRATTQAGPPPANPPPPWRVSFDQNGGGIMSNWGCYDMDYMLGVTGWQLRPRSVLARWWPVSPAFAATRVAPGSDAETHLTALVQCEDGIAFTIERGEFMTTPGAQHWLVVGDNGSLTLQMTACEGKKITFWRADSEAGAVEETVWQGEEDYGSAHSGPVTDFAAAIRDRRPPKTGLRQALVMQQITDAIYASGNANAVVTIAETDNQ